MSILTVESEGEGDGERGSCGLSKGSMTSVSEIRSGTTAFS